MFILVLLSNKFFTGGSLVIKTYLIDLVPPKGGGLLKGLLKYNHCSFGLLKPLPPFDLLNKYDFTGTKTGSSKNIGFIL